MFLFHLFSREEVKCWFRVLSLAVRSCVCRHTVEEESGKVKVCTGPQLKHITQNLL